MSSEVPSDCVSIQHCPSQKQFHIIGRAAPDQCLECCSHDGCNRELCAVQDHSGTQSVYEYYMKHMIGAMTLIDNAGMCTEAAMFTS